MIRLAVTGGGGFIGSNLREAIGQTPGMEGSSITRETGSDERSRILAEAAVIVHLAGSNRPVDPREFLKVNRDMTARLVDDLLDLERKPLLIFASSVQAAGDTEYGRSKRAGELEVERYGDGGGAARVYRLPNVFGKWCRPDYNSVVATFCHRVARGEPIEVHDPEAELELVHVSDVVAEFLSRAREGGAPGCMSGEVVPTFPTTVGVIAELIRSFPETRDTSVVPDLADRLTELMYSTYLSHVPVGDLSYALSERSDERGRLAELLKSEHAGQVFVSTTRPGRVRGGHSHRVKFEKFLVLAGDGLIRIRDGRGGEVVEIPVRGDAWSVVEIPPGSIHDIENVGDTDLVVLFWASEMFDPDAPDTYYGSV